MTSFLITSKKVGSRSYFNHHGHILTSVTIPSFHSFASGSAHRLAVGATFDFLGGPPY